MMSQSPGQRLSPLTGSPGEPVRSIAVSDIVAAYRREHHIDVSKYLPGGAASLDVLRCTDTGLQFFAQSALAGPPAFYEELYSASSLYQHQKWEFDAGARLLGGARSVLDVGCGGGAFLESLRRLGIQLFGLETSRFGQNAARTAGLEVFAESIVEHATRASARYDAVTAFQVLEHIDEPGVFIAGCISVLKPGGRLILSVPNNESFLKHCNILPLNHPPHHVTFWSRRTLESLVRIFPLNLAWIEHEPLQEGDIDWYQFAMQQRYVPASKLARAIYFRFGGATAFRRYLEENRMTIHGHTILAAYAKRG